MASSTNIPTPPRSRIARSTSAPPRRCRRASTAPSLNADDQLSYDLLLYRNARAASIFPYRRNAYVFDQMNGAQADIPAFLINIHKVDSEADARAYISRLQQTGRYIDQAVAEVDRARESWRASAALGLPAGHRAIANIIAGAPFTARQGQ